MYIRTKKIKNTLYAYLVSARWSKRRKAPKQKTVKYLGKLYKIKKIYNKPFEKYIKKNLSLYLKKNLYKKIVFDLVCCELVNHRFKEIKKDIWNHKNLVVDLKTKKVYDLNTNKTVCLEINNNFLTTHTLRNIVYFNFLPNLTKIQIGKSLAKAFLSAGIMLPEDIFVTLFQKISKEF